MGAPKHDDGGPAAASYSGIGRRRQEGSVAKRPRDVRSEADLLALRTDNASTESGWVLVHEDHVAIGQRRCGEPPAAIVELPQAEFRRLVDWYNRPQKGRRCG